MIGTGHTASLWQGSKLLVYGGENEHRAYLSDVIIFDVNTAHWTQPDLYGPTPRGRARHSAVIHDDKLYIVGGMTGNDSYVLDDICYLDLKTWTWSRTWRFVPRYDHSSWIWGGRIWVFGGMGEDMERSNEIWWLDLRGTPAFESGALEESSDQYPIMNKRISRTSYQSQSNATLGSTGYAANSSSVQVTAPHTALRQAPVAPGSISSVKFVSSPNLPAQALGTHFHVYSSGCLLDFVTPASISSIETSLTALDLDTLRWRRLADGKELFRPNYRWHYCAMNEDATYAWLLGCPNDNSNVNANGEELSDVLQIDLTRVGLLGNKLASESQSATQSIPVSDSRLTSCLSGIGADLASIFDQPPETGSGVDFIVTGEKDDSITGDALPDSASNEELGGSLGSTSPLIHVHKMMLRARWPHFDRLYTSQMAEFHTKKMHIPEPYSTVRSFLHYLYTDSIAPHPQYGFSLANIAGMLVMSNIYDMPRLRLLCINRLSRELDIEHAALIWERASTAGENWLRRRAASFCMLHWGRIVRTSAFRRLDKPSLITLCEESDIDSRIVGGDELEAVGGLGGMKFGVGGILKDGRKRRACSITQLASEEQEDEDEGDDEGMELS